MIDFPLGALTLPEPACAEAWRQWRASIDLDDLSYERQQFVAAVAGRLPRWIDGDASAARFHGIVKMVWTRNQVRLHKAAEVIQTLLRNSVEPASIVGPLAWSLVTREAGAMRSIPHLTVLIQREHLGAASSALMADGWTLCTELPSEEALDWSCYLALTKGDEALHLHWRLFPATAGQAAACERAFLEHSGSVVWNRDCFQTLSPEADLLYRLMDREPWDPTPWQVDALMTPFATIDWGRFRTLSHRFAPTFDVDVLSRLLELRRSWQLPIPEIPPVRQPLFSSARALALVKQFTFAQLRRLLSVGGRLLWRS